MVCMTFQLLTSQVFFIQVPFAPPIVKSSDRLQKLTNPWFNLAFCYSNLWDPIQISNINNKRYDQLF